MNLSGDILEASYAFCRRMSRRSGSNFYLGFLLLPRQKRRAMDALYAFMRHSDDLADALPSGSKNALDATINHRREQLNRWREALQNSLACSEGVCVDPDSLPQRQKLDVESVADSILPALVDTVQSFQIPTDYLFQVLDGVEMDLYRCRYRTFDELRLYCLRVASAVGLACIHIWGFRGQGTPEDNAPREFARQVGVALQLTNIIRDLKSDATAGRIYLPLEDLHKCGYSEEELQKGVVNEAFYSLMAMEINRAEQFYREGCKLSDWLDRDGQRIFGLMISTYWQLLKKIAQQPECVFSGPVRLGNLQRLLLAASWAIMPLPMKLKVNEKTQSVM
jgi:15-cis-phytoene synthase